MKNRHRDWVRSLYDQYAPDLYRLARHRLRDPDLAHDLVQEVFLTLVAKADQVRDHPKPIAWLLKTMEYKLLQEFDRQENKRKREAPDIDLTWLADNYDPRAHSIDEVLPTQLTDRERTVLKLIYEEGLSYREAAFRLGVPPATCGTWVHRAKRKCREYLKEGTP